VFSIRKSRKLTVGYIFASKTLEKEDRMFMRLAKKKGIDLVMFNFFRKVDEDEFESRIKKCDLVYNNTAEDFVIESLKTVEELGKKVIDTSKLFYYTEDKWMFYVKCREHRIPTPDTILLSNNLNVARAELKHFGKWPVVLKRVYGMGGKFVEKADTPAQALRVIRRFWDMDCDKLPIIAQEFIPSHSYRVTIIDKKIVQTAIKKGKSWKHTGAYAERFARFRVDSNLKKILSKMIDMTRINVCGVDLLRRGDQWLVTEVNSDPSLKFIDKDHAKLVGLVLDFLKRYYKRHRRKSRVKKRATSRSTS
jgi:glutathione synthase/RimK-type ligase-like ATP-grasp enzyme